MASELEAIAMAGGRRTKEGAPRPDTSTNEVSAVSPTVEADAPARDEQATTPQMAQVEQSGSTVTSDSAAQAGGYVAPTSVPKRAATDTLASAGVSAIETRLSPEEQVDLSAGDESSRVTRNIRAVAAPSAVEDLGEDDIVLPGVRSGARKLMYIGAIVAGTAVGAVLFLQRAQPDENPSTQAAVEANEPGENAKADDEASRESTTPAATAKPPKEDAPASDEQEANQPSDEKPGDEKPGDEKPGDEKPSADDSKPSAASEPADARRASAPAPAPKPAAQRPAPKPPAPKPPAVTKPPPSPKPEPATKPAPAPKKSSTRSAIVRDNPF